MSLNFFHESIKYLYLLILSMTHSYNYLNYIPFIIIYIRETKQMDFFNNIFLLIYFIIYEITKYPSFSLTIRINDLIGEYYYYLFSICILSVINLIFSFLSFSFFNIFILITYRLFISLFNNIVSSIDLPLSLLYTKKQIIFKKRNFSFFQKLTNFIFFFYFLIFYHFLKQFYIYCFIGSLMNLISFILCLILISCHNENLYNKYIPSISEKENDNSMIKTYQKSKTENKNNEIMVDIYNNSNSVSNNNNISIGMNNVDNLIKENKNKVNEKLINNESIKNDIKSIEKATKINIRKNTSIIKGLIPTYTNKDNQITKNNNNEKKNLISLLFVLILSKELNFLSFYLLLFKINDINIVSFIDENNNELLFNKFSSFFKLNTIKEEYIFLFMLNYALNVFLYFLNLLYTSIALKKKIINYIFYYFSIIIFFVSSLIFTYYYSQESDNTKTSTNEIRKGIIIFFVINFIMNECIMIMSVYFNIFGKKKGFSEKLLKDIKASSLFLSSVIFSLSESLISLANSKTNKIYENYIYYIEFCSFNILIIITSIFFLNY